MRRLAVQIIFEAELVPVEAGLFIADVLDRVPDGRFDLVERARRPFSPASTTSCVVVSVSHATRASGSFARNRSTIESLI